MLINQRKLLFYLVVGRRRRRGRPCDKISILLAVGAHEREAGQLDPLGNQYVNLRPSQLARARTARVRLPRRHQQKSFQLDPVAARARYRTGWGHPDLAQAVCNHYKPAIAPSLLLQQSSCVQVLLILGVVSARDSRG